MTVFSTSYSSIDEVWENSYLSPKIQKKDKKKNVRSDPICELYETGSSYNENDLISYANKYYEQHEKAKYQKPMMNMEAEPREMNPKYIEVTGDKAAPEVHYDSDVEQELNKRVFKEQRIETPSRDYLLERDMAMSKPVKEYFVDDDDFEKRNNNFNLFDVVLYIISGIILIFMMEQFVKIGMLMN